MANREFDPEVYKATTHRQWDSAAEAWHRWGGTLEAWLGEATELMLDLARVGPGCRVLDVAAGAGGQSLAAARRVGPSGSVLATDISREILEYARASAQSLGLENLEVLQVDGEMLSFEPTFDAAISRLGLMFFPDPIKALLGIRGSFKPGGRFAAITFSTPENNAFFSIPIDIARRRANLPAPLPGQPGPFSLGQDGVLEDVLRRAGFAEIEVVKVDSPVRVDSTEVFMRFARESFGGLHQMMVSLSPDEQEEVWQEIEAAMRAFEGESGFEGPCELLVGVGVGRPA